MTKDVMSIFSLFIYSFYLFVHMLVYYFVCCLMYEGVVCLLVFLEGPAL